MTNGFAPRPLPLKYPVYNREGKLITRVPNETKGKLLFLKYQVYCSHAVNQGQDRKTKQLEELCGVKKLYSFIPIT